MLPEDAKLRKSAMLDKGQQLSVTDHFGPEDMDRPIPYNDEAFRNATMEWVIETNQVRPHQKHIILFILNNLHICSPYRRLAKPHTRT